MSLAATSFAAFFLPLNQVMPRVAIGFVSFLSLAVFRSQAYAMLPKKPTSLVWVDAAMLLITNIMWIAVIMNIVALVVNGKHSIHGAMFVDKVVRFVFPFTSLVALILLFVMGLMNLDPITIMIWVHVVLVSSGVIMSGIIARFLIRLPQVLLHMLAQELANKKLIWQDGVQLEPRELALVFRLLDKDGSGSITTDETVQGFERSGLRFSTDEERERFRSHVAIRRVSGEEFQANHELGLDEFRDHFKKLLGGVLVRRVRRSASSSALGGIGEEEMTEI